MAYTNSSLVSYKKISPNKTSPRNHKIDTITIHCVVGQCSVEALGNVFSSTSKQASSNYGIGYDGKIGMYVEEKDRSWCSSNATNDNRAVTIEVACDATHPYAVNSKAMSSLIKLVTDICKRNGIKKLVWSTNKNDRVNHKNGCNMTVHRDYANKACPGKYLYDRHGQIAEAVNKALSSGKTVNNPVNNPVKEEVKTVKIGMPILKKGNSGAAVKTLQRLLRSLKYLNTDGKTYIEIDGSFGSNTEAAVKRYQKNAAIGIDGIVGAKTWNKLLNGK